MLRIQFQSITWTYSLDEEPTSQVVSADLEFRSISSTSPTNKLATIPEEDAASNSTEETQFDLSDCSSEISLATTLAEDLEQIHIDIRPKDPQ